MKPTIGRVVIYQPTPDDQGQSSSTEGFPAVITRVWTDTCVNLQVLRDFDTPIAITSVEKMPDPVVGDGSEQAQQLPLPRSWRWPPRI
jgi:hypothetical protein